MMLEIHIPVTTTLKTARLFLRYPKVDDATQIHAAVQSPLFPEQLPLKEMGTEDMIKTWLEMLQKGWEKGRVFSWIAEEQSTKELVGQVTLSRLEEDHSWALAFWVHPEDWLRGYATEGAERVLAFGFENLDAKKIWAAAGVWNTGSCKVLEKTGMKFIAENPEGYYSKGQPIKTREYEISIETWQKRDRTKA